MAIEGREMHLTGISKSDRTKLSLATEITKRIQKTGLSQRDVSKQIGLSRTKIVAMKQGRVGGISLEKMLAILEELGERVAIVIGEDARETCIEYETDMERYLRIHGDGPIPKKYISGFMVNLAAGFSVEILADPKEWERYQLPFGGMWDDIVHRPEDREVEKALKCMLYSALRAGETERSWRQHQNTFDLARSQLRHEKQLVPRLDQVLQRAHRVVCEMARDFGRHQRKLAEFERSKDQGNDTELVMFSDFK
ncbi:hypothetical protein FGK63_20200 [Ruegeria sediminis]|uniref:HTH cro/C1-type domain-containing protein n=1 Tax=Ruegeria sediminis TaxID=2583820 RepID=A0ABY2WRX9_9RHOB|nr:XRE family transcriptional regulator [Ruegeria sediminis]TMV02554.1 hypothetical protein FGK63_20200 [Ruegeria sediminis]